MVLIVDLIINTALYLPVTGVGATTVQQIQAMYNSNPKGIPVPQLISINKIDTLNEKLTGLIGSASYYNKKIGTTKLTDYPSYFKSTDIFFKSSQKDFVLGKPYVFLLSGNSNLQVKKFSPQNIVIDVKTERDDTMFLLQNYYTFWKAYNNNTEVPVQRSFTTFMSVPVHQGNNNIEFIYKDPHLIYFVIISVLTLIIIVTIIIINHKKQSDYIFTTAVPLK